MHAELPSYGPRPAPTNADRIDNYLRVLNALMLRDMRARFFGSYWGWLAWTLWPVAHVFIISLAMVFRKMPPPFGDSTLLFAATGAVPALAFSYISQEVMKGLLRNKPLTYYPQVRTFDVVISVMMVEIVDSFLAVMIVSTILIASGVSPVPEDVAMAIGGYVAAIVFGISMGMLNAAIAAIIPGYSIGYIGIRLAMYFTSGAMYVAHEMPAEIYGYLKWNPLMQIVEWVRLGYEPRLPIEVDYFYVITWILSVMALGLAAERTVSRRYAS